MKPNPTCKELYAAQSDMEDKLREKYGVAMYAAIQREFPIGTKVQFRHGPNWLDAEVTEHSGADWWKAEKVQVKNSKTGIRRDIPAYELRLPPAP